MLSMKFLCQFPLPKINITFFCGVVGGGGGGGGAGATLTSPKFDLFSSAETATIETTSWRISLSSSGFCRG